MKVTWSIKYTTEIPDEEFDNCKTQEERDEIIDSYIQDINRYNSRIW